MWRIIFVKKIWYKVIWWSVFVYYVWWESDVIEVMEMIVVYLSDVCKMR